MKTFLKVLGIAIVVIVALAAGAGAWLSLKKPAQRPASADKVAMTPERIARGKYLAEHVSACLDCHSDHVLAYSLPVKPGTEGLGGYIFDKKVGFPGVVAAQNITQDPADGLGKWTDGEIMRAMREGIDRNGDALFPMMPYQHLRIMSDDDAKAIVAYLRTLKPLPNHVPDKKIDFPVNLFVKLAPKPLDGPVPPPDRKDSVAYGKYLATIGGCYECHTPHDRHHAVVAAQAFTGGWEMAGPWGRNFTANLTPDPANYMGQATKAEFISRFHSFAGLNAANAPKTPPGRNTVMPWIAFSVAQELDRVAHDSRRAQCTPHGRGRVRFALGRRACGR